jgi:hypothetical protein
MDLVNFNGAPVDVDPVAVVSLTVAGVPLIMTAGEPDAAWDPADGVFADGPFAASAAGGGDGLRIDAKTGCCCCCCCCCAVAPACCPVRAAALAPAFDTTPTDLTEGDPAILDPGDAPAAVKDSEPPGINVNPCAAGLSPRLLLLILLLLPLLPNVCACACPAADGADEAGAGAVPPKAAVVSAEVIAVPSPDMAGGVAVERAGVEMGVPDTESETVVLVLGPAVCGWTCGV